MKRLFDNLVDVTIVRLKQFEPPEGYYLAFSGGKDSIVILKIAQLAGVKFDAHYSLTTIDPPELVQFIRRHYPDVHWERPVKPLLSQIVKHGFPIRQSRWCCEYYKENGGSGRFLITGIRAAESHNRGKRQMVETCYNQPNKRFIHPIIDWTTSDVWTFIQNNKLPYCCLYDEGFTRIGCVLCPMQTVEGKARDIKRFPIMAANWKKAFVKLYEARRANGSKSVDRWKSGEEMFEWWVSNKPTEKINDNQMSFA